MGIKNTLQSGGLYLGLPLLLAARLKAEDQFGYRHEFYQEHNGRTRVEADTLLVQKILAPWLDLKIEGVYDAISGATPIGAPTPESITLRNPYTGASLSGSGVRSFRRAGGNDAVSGASSTGTISVRSASELPTANVTDIRRAFNVAAGMTFGRHRIAPQFSFSEEIDYVSKAVGLNYTLEFNNKNTALNLSWSHAFDRIVPNQSTFIQEVKNKDSDDFLAGVTQLLGPKTVLTFNAIFGHAEGYFNDPYKGVIFESSPSLRPDVISIYEEKRPAHRTKQAAYVSVTQAITPLSASIEGSYRYYHDSFEIHAHTVSLSWRQKAGSWLVISPSFRYYNQSAASFYATQFPGDPTVAAASVPKYYSADYRLSALNSFTCGIQATVKVREWLEFDAGYQRYNMTGLDGITAKSAYPTADIFTLGAAIKF